MCLINAYYSGVSKSEVEEGDEDTQRREAESRGRIYSDSSLIPRPDLHAGQLADLKVRPGAGRIFLWMSGNKYDDNIIMLNLC